MMNLPHPFGSAESLKVTTKGESPKRDEEQ